MTNKYIKNKYYIHFYKKVKNESTIGSRWL